MAHSARLVELFPGQPRTRPSTIGFAIGRALLGGLVTAAIAAGSGSSTPSALHMVVAAAACTLALNRWLPEVRGRTLDASAAEEVIT